MSSSMPFSALPITELGGIKGRVILPGDADYDQARTPFYGGIDRHPAAIVRVANAADVARVVTFAREHDAELAVRSGGHSFAGYSVTEGGLVVDLAEMNGLEIDLDTRTAWAQTGLTAGAYTVAAAEHGLATGFGDTGSVGIGGITLAGGIGYLVRKHGMTIDSLLAADVVTADGELLRVDAESHPDLFWAIRGGGGNFGVATRLRFRLHELGTVIGGMLILPASPELIASFIEEAEAAPDELSTIASIMPAPPMPFIDPEHYGKLIVFALMMFAGDVEAGERAVAPFRALGKPLSDMLRPISYPEMYLPEEEGFHPIGSAHSMFVDEINLGHAKTILEQLEASTAMMRVTQLRVLGGAMARVPVDATAFAHRQSRIMANVATLYESIDEAPTHEAWTQGLASALQGEDRGVYTGFMGDEGEGRVHDAYPGPTWDRLAAIKRRYDPTNLFRLNHNIPPAPA